MESKHMASSSVPPRSVAVKAGSSNSKSAGGAEASGRLKGVQVVKPIIYGNVAWYLGKKREEDGHTHQWTVYLKPYEDEDMSVYIKRVHFKLHESYAEPNRVFHAPPYSITETGWGEFEITIKIFFQDSNERPVTLYHFLKLFDRDNDGNVKMGTDPVDSELYDEIVFQDPTAKMHKLFALAKLSSVLPQHKVDYEQKKIDDLEKILNAKKKVKQGIEELKAKLALAKGNIGELKSQVTN